MSQLTEQRAAGLEDTTAPARGRLHRAAGVKRALEPYGFLLPTVALLTVLMLIPVYLVISYSFMDNVVLNENPVFVGFRNYVDVLTDAVFFTAVKNTAFFTITSVVAHFAIGLAFAVMLNSPHLGSKAKAVFRGVYILPWMFTVAVIAVLWRMLLNPNGVVNYVLIELGLTDEGIEWLASIELSLLAVTFINIWSGYPFFMMSLLAGLQGIPGDLYEAAMVDGAGSIQRFRRVTIPQLRPIIISMALLDMIWTSQQFALIWMTTGGGPINATEMLSTFTYKLAFTRYEFALASTSAVLVLLLSMVLAFFYVRHQKGWD